MAALVLAGRYRLQKALSGTAMAEVWSAHDEDLDRRVVVKLLASDADRLRFEREARDAAALAHPNIVQLFDFGEEDGRPYMVFEYLPGGSLEARLSAGGGPLPDEETARVVRDIAAGLAHAHERGVVHRDLKPANVLFDPEDRAKIADFGIARLFGEDTLTDAGTVVGTAAYISPEQTRAERATPATDVYAFGVVLYRLLTGRLPFEGDSAAALAAMHRDAEPPDPASVRRDVPPELATLAEAALAKAPESRPPDGAALLRALVAPDIAAAIDLDVTQVIEAKAARRRVTPLRLAAAITLVLLALAGIVTATAMTDDPVRAPAEPTRSTVGTHTSQTSTAERTSNPVTTRATSSNRSTTDRTTTRTATTAPSTRQDTTVPSPTTTIDTALPSTAETPTATLP